MVVIRAVAKYCSAINPSKQSASHITDMVESMCMVRVNFHPSVSTCHSNLVSCKPRQPALPLSQPEGQHSMVVFSVMKGKAVSGGSSSTPTQ